jgi:hypothetical protein
VWIIGTIAVLAGVAAVATAFLTEPALPLAPPPDVGPVDADALRTADLPVVRHGYDRHAVDVLLAGAAATITDLEARVTAAETGADRVVSGEELEDGGGDRPGSLEG